ncbi:hypothetical protein KIS4809_5354 [Bacillus sp. ZZV12-4809]|nr:hypothetical protein KIS4809_5354 [Bacillus sp. ZZV12-4809]
MKEWKSKKIARSEADLAIFYLACLKQFRYFEDVKVSGTFSIQLQHKAVTFNRYSI